MAVQTATNGRSASHSRAKVGVAIFPRWSAVGLGGGLGGGQRRGDRHDRRRDVEMRAEEERGTPCQLGAEKVPAVLQCDQVTLRGCVVQQVICSRPRRSVATHQATPA
jgi:hypothetical protein